MTGFGKVLPFQKFFRSFSLVCARDFLHNMFGFEQDRTLIRLLLASKPLKAEGNSKKSGKPECFVAAHFFEVSTKAFRTHINTKYRLNQWA